MCQCRVHCIMPEVPLAMRNHRFGFPGVFPCGIGLGTIVVIPLTTLGFALPKLAVFSSAASLAMLGLSNRRSLPDCSFLLRTWTGRALCAYAAVLLASLLWSTAPLLSIVGAAPRFEGLLTHIVFLSLGFTAFAAAQRDDGKRMLWGTLVLSNAMVVLYGLAQFLGLDPLRAVWEEEAVLGRMFSFLGQPNALGRFVLLALPFVALGAGRALCPGGRQKRSHCMAFAILIVCNLFVLLGTASRASLAGLFVMLAVFIIVSARPIAAMITGRNVRIAALVFLLLFAAGWKAYGSRFASPAEAGRSASARRVIWNTAWDMVRQRPYGYGLETTGIVSNRFLTPEFYEYEGITTGIDRAHSKPLDLLVTLGVQGLVAYYGFLALLILLLWKRRRDPLIFAGTLAILGYSVSLLVEFESIVTAVFFWMIAGWMLGHAALPCKRAAHVSRTVFRRIIGGYAPRAALTATALLLVASSVVTIQWVRARWAMENAQRQSAQGEIVRSLESSLEAVRRFRFDREILWIAAARALDVLERTEDPRAGEALHILIGSMIDRLGSLTAGQDGNVPLLRAWHAALEGDAGGVDGYLRRARELMPASIIAERIAMRAYGILRDKGGVEDARTRLIRLLPPSWEDPSSERGRILRKENPWLSELMGG